MILVPRLIWSQQLKLGPKQEGSLGHVDMDLQAEMSTLGFQIGMERGGIQNHKWVKLSGTGGKEVIAGREGRRWPRVEYLFL